MNIYLMKMNDLLTSTYSKRHIKQNNNKTKRKQLRNDDVNVFK